MSIWFSSDFHLNHVNIIRFCNRPFANVDEMNRELIARHNAVVQKDDLVYNLGDFSMSEKIVPEALRQMNGKIILIAGNHDKCHPTHGHKAEAAKLRYLEYGFAEVHFEMRVEPFLLNHMPYLSKDDSGYEARYSEYRPKDEGSLLLHGHQHNRFGNVRRRMIDVGVDGWNYSPIKYETLLEIAK